MRWIRASTVLISSLLVACASTRSRDARAEVESAMQRYQVAARAVDVDAMANFFTQTALLLEPGMPPTYSRESIRAFFASFPGARVEVATATPDAIEVFGDTALYWGAYFERLSFPGQPLSEQHGKFVVEWKRDANGAWLIERFLRVPVPDPDVR